MTKNLKGTTYHKGNRSWQAQIKHDGRMIYLGTFFTAEKAHEAYKKKKAELLGIENK